MIEGAPRESSAIASHSREHAPSFPHPIRRLIDRVVDLSLEPSRSTWHYGEFAVQRYLDQIDFPYGNGQWVLFLPGFGGPDPYLRPAKKLFATRGFNILPSGIRINLAAMGRNIRHTVEALDSISEPVVVASHSLGANVGRAATIQRPEKVRAFIEMAPVKKGFLHRGIKQHVRTFDRKDYESISKPIPSHIPVLHVQAGHDGILGRDDTESIDSHAIRARVKGPHASLFWDLEVFNHMGRFLLEHDLATERPANVIPFPTQRVVAEVGHP